MLYRSYYDTDIRPRRRPAAPLNGPPSHEDTFREIAVALAVLLGLAAGSGLLIHLLGH